MQGNTYTAQTAHQTATTNKLIRNTYMLLSMTLIFSAIMATVSVFLRLPGFTYLVSVIAGFILASFVLPRYANSSAGIGLVFLITGLLGLGLGPLLGMYLSLPNGSQTVGTALGGTGIIFLTLSGYALTTRRDFSFMGGFLMTGFIVVLVASLASIFLNMPALNLAISGAVVMLMSGFLLFQTSQMVNGQETNYILATVGLYITMFNIFVHLLQLIGFANND